MRSDLAALSIDSLAALSNRGLVKRAERELDAGAPTVVESPDGTVTATFDDGVVAVLAPGVSLERAGCSCPATNVCRHLLMAVLAYQRAGARPAAADGEPPMPTDVAESSELSEQALSERVASEPVWSPGEFTDEQLVAEFGVRAVNRARRAWRAGYRARVRRPSGPASVVSVELSTCTVSFLVAGDLGYATADAAASARDDAVALAVWACRAADAVDPTASVLDLDVNGSGQVAGAHGSGLDVLLPILAELVDVGVAHLPGGFGASLGIGRRALEAAGQRWPLDALGELDEQFDAYARRSARYSATTTSRLAAELIARHRAVERGGDVVASDVLGSDEAAETPLRLLRLVGLGARVTGEGPERRVDVYLAHPSADAVLTLRRDVTLPDDAAVDAVARTRTNGLRLRDLAAGNVVTESAVRAANRLVRIATSRVGKTTVSASNGDWSALGGSLTITDLDAEAAWLATLPPAMIRPRIVADRVRAVVVTSVGAARYSPGEQRLDASVTSIAGEATITVSHSSASPGAVDSLSRCIAGEHGAIRSIAGHLRRSGGGIEIEVTAVATDSGVVVPAFAQGPAGVVGFVPFAVDDPVTLALDGVESVVSELVHRGRRLVPRNWTARCADAVADARRTGLSRLADSLAVLAGAIDGDADQTAVLDAWADVAIRLFVTREQR